MGLGSALERSLTQMESMMSLSINKLGHANNFFYVLY